MKTHRKLNSLEARKPEYRSKPEKYKNNKDRDSISNQHTTTCAEIGKITDCTFSSTSTHANFINGHRIT